MTKIFSLFEGRHEMPSTIIGAICSSYDFNNMSVVKTDNWNILLKEGGDLYVTGLTPALTQFLNEWVKFHYVQWKDASQTCDVSADYVQPKLNLLHYNNVTKEYILKDIF